MMLWRRKQRPETNAERLKRLYVVGKLTLHALMEQIDTQLAAGTLDDACPDPYRDAIRRSALSPEYVTARWAASASAAAASWTTPRARDTLTGSSD